MNKLKKIAGFICHEGDDFMIGNIIAIVSSIWFIGLIIFILCIIEKQDNKTISEKLKYLTIELFHNKNWFGIVLSVLACIIMIPSYIILLIIEATCTFYEILQHIWELGEKR